LAASLSLLLLASATACSTTATITNKDATRAEVRIARSTPTELIVATRDGERVIERDHVQEIDHPGNVAVVAGAALLAAGAANLAGLYRCRENESSDFCVGWAVGGALAGSGLGLLIWGGTVWTNSVEAAGGAPSPVARLAPAVLGGPGRLSPGATLALSF
jgi:hypothetical protein